MDRASARLSDTHRLIIELSRIHGMLLQTPHTITVEEIMDQLWYARGLADQIERSLHPRRKSKVGVKNCRVDHLATAKYFHWTRSDMWNCNRRPRCPTFLSPYGELNDLKSLS